MRKITYLQLFFMFFVTWFLFSMAFSQIIPYMNVIGLSENERSWVWTISSCIGIVVQLLIGYLSDKHQRIKRYFLFSLIILIISSTLAYQHFESQLGFYFFTIAVFIAFFRIASNLIETWCIQMNEEVMRHFGVIRIFGSIGWAVGSITAAQIIAQSGYHRIAVWLIVAGLIILLTALNLVDSKKVSSSMNLEFKYLKMLFSNTQYLLALIIFFILFLVYALDSLTVVDKMIEINSSSDQIGLRWGLQAMVEIPLMIIGFKFIDYFSPRKIIAFTAFVFALRYSLYGFAMTPNQMIVISVLQAITFPFLLLTQKVIVNMTTPLELRSTGHMLMTAITSNIPIIIVPLLSSFLHQYISYSVILVIGGLLCFIPMILSFKLEKETI